MGRQLPLVKGTVDMLVLKALSWGPMHGFGISQWLEERSRGALGLDDSAMYQVLHRVEARGLGQCRVADHRQQPPRPILQAHAARTGAPARRN